MKSKFLTLLSAVLAIAFSTTAFVGCNSSNQGENNPGGDTTIDTPNNPDSNPNNPDSKPNNPDSNPDAEKTYTVRFLVDGEVYHTVTGKEGARIVAPKTKPTKEGFKFKKWDGFTAGTKFSENKDYVALFEEVFVPSVAVAAEGTFDQTTLAKDAIFSTARDITEFTLAQNKENAAAADKAFTVSLVHDETYLYVYIYSADKDCNDDDRLSFYLVEKGSTTTKNVQTYPNKAEPYSSNKDLCDEINVGKVEGGYALKAKIALSKLETKDSKVGFGIRFVDMNNKVVYLSTDSVADDSSNTKVEQAAHLPFLTLESKTPAAPAAPSTSD